MKLGHGYTNSYTELISEFGIIYSKSISHVDNLSNNFISL